ncbi:MAG: extracellular solute-binding protein [Anaerolineae bacterium]|nr:extracellular solute-binding protein [Anaerolineae bacterium]
MSRLAKLLFAALILISSFAGLSQVAVAQDGPQYAGLDKDLTGVTIRMANIGGGQYEAMYKSISMFEDKTHAKVEIVFLGDGFEIDKKLKTDYATSAVDYDVAWDHTSFMAQYKDYVEDMRQWFSDADLAHFSKAIIDAATVDGKLLLIPRHADIAAFHYRTDIFDDAKIKDAYKAEMGKDLVVPTTLEEVDSVGRFLVKGGYVKYGYGMAGKEEALTGRFYELLFASGGQFLNDKNEPAFNSEIGVKVATLLRDWYKDGIIAADTPNLLWDGDAANFCNGSVAMKLEWYGWYSYFQDPKSCPTIAGKFGLTRGFLGFAGEGARPTGWAGAHAFSIPTAAKNKEAAAQLIKFLTSEAVAYDEAKLGFLPVRDDVWTRLINDASSAANPLDKVRLETAQLQISEDFKTPPITADWIPISNVLYPTIQKIILGDVEPQAGLDSAAAEARTILEQSGSIKQ